MREASGLGLAVLLLVAGCGGGGGGGGPSIPPPPPSPPAIASVVPASGAPGARVTITGTNFEAFSFLNVVFFGDTQAAVVSANPTEIVVDVPPGAEQPGQSGPLAVDLTVITRRAQSAPASFGVLPGPPGGPQIAAISPIAGPGLSVVTVTGSGFAPAPDDNAVTVNGSPARVLGAAPSQLTVEVPSNATAGKLVVGVNGDFSNGATFHVTSSAPPPSLGGVGDNNLSYVTASPFTHLVIEVNPEQGNVPTNAALTRLRDEILKRIRKPGGVAIVVGSTFSAIASTWDESLIRQQEMLVRRHFDSQNATVLHLLFVGGQFTPPNVVGLTYSASSSAVFEARLRSRTGPLAVDDVETAVIVHEAGHALGLVDITTPMQAQHEDPASPGHDISDQCVMFSSITLGPGVLANPPPTAFDARCADDLRAIGGK